MCCVGVVVDFVVVAQCSLAAGVIFGGFQPSPEPSGQSNSCLTGRRVVSSKRFSCRWESKREMDVIKVVNILCLDDGDVMGSNEHATDTRSAKPHP
jgi:hypothetical protein